MKRLLLMVWIAFISVSGGRAGEAASPPAPEVYPSATERLPRPAVTPEPGIHGLGLGSAWNRGPAGAVTGVCPGGTAPNAIGSAGIAPLTPTLGPSYGATLGAPTLDNQALGGSRPVYGATLRGKSRYGAGIGAGPIEYASRHVLSASRT